MAILCMTRKRVSFHPTNDKYHQRHAWFFLSVVVSEEKANTAFGVVVDDDDDDDDDDNNNNKDKDKDLSLIHI